MSKEELQAAVELARLKYKAAAFDALVKEFTNKCQYVGSKMVYDSVDCGRGLREHINRKQVNTFSLELRIDSVPPKEYPNIERAFYLLIPEKERYALRAEAGL